jgi:hypothetical protein
MLDLNFGTAKYLVRSRSSLLHAFLFQPGEVPDPDGLIQGSAGNEGIIWMEAGRHNIVAMSCEDGDNTPILPVPQPDSLVITAGDDPWQLFVELYRPDVVQMAREGEHALLGLVVPNLHFVIVSATHEHWLGLMEIYTSHGT